MEYMWSFRMTEDKNITKKHPSKVSLPKDMELEFKELQEYDKSLGFESYREFVKDAVRNNLVKYRKIAINKDFKKN